MSNKSEMLNNGDLAACGESLRQRGLAFICVKYFT